MTGAAYNLPTKVKVAPYTYRVEEHDKLSALAGAQGACITDDERIVMDAGLGGQVKQEVLLHELLHAVWSQTHLRGKYNDDTQDSEGEVIISVLAPRLLGLLRDNPRLVEFLTS